MSVSIKIDGLTSAKQYLKNTDSAVYKAADKAIVESGFFVEGEVKKSIAGQSAEPRSVDTGRFLNSVKAEQKKALTSTISTNVPYAKHLEYGTSRIKPRHHFTNSAKRSEVKVKDFVKNAIKKAI